MSGELGTLDYVQQSLTVSWHEKKNIRVLDTVSSRDRYPSGEKPSSYGNT